MSVTRIARRLVVMALVMAGWPAGTYAQGDGSGELSLRKNLRLAATPAVRPYVEESVRYFHSRHSFPPATVDVGPSSEVFNRFCGGVGVDFPDAVAAPRRISRNEFRRCGDHDASGIIEVAVGYEVLALAGAKGTLPFNVTAENLYRALALEVPRDGTFYANTSRQWRDIDPRFPEQSIRVSLPPIENGLRHLFDDRAMEGGCRHVPEVRAIFTAAERVRKCIAAREDGRIVEGAAPDEVIRFLEGAPPGAVAVTTLKGYEALPGRFPLLSFEGVLPTQQSVESGEYLLARTIYFYFKIGHMHGRRGYGVTRGLTEFMLDVASEQALDPGGYFEQQGLVLLPPPERARQRLQALMVRPMSR